VQSTKVGNFQGILRFSLKTTEDKFNQANAFPQLSRGLMSSQPVRCKTNVSIPAFTPGFQLVEYLSAISVATVCQILSRLPLFHHTGSKVFLQILLGLLEFFPQFDWFCESIFLARAGVLRKLLFK